MRSFVASNQIKPFSALTKGDQFVLGMRRLEKSFNVLVKEWKAFCLVQNFLENRGQNIKFKIIEYQDRLYHLRSEASSLLFGTLSTPDIPIQELSKLVSADPLWLNKTPSGIYELLISTFNEFYDGQIRPLVNVSLSD